MILTGENRSIRRKKCASTTLSTTDLAWNDQGSKPSLCGERPATDCLSDGTASKSNINVNYT